MMSLDEDPVVDLPADHEGSTRQESDWLHGMWTKWCRKASGRSRRIRPGQRVQVVVVDHHHRLLDLGDLLQHRPREVLVDGVVAELERLGLVAADVRRVGEIPQVVLDEPQHRVGDDVVEGVVGVGVGRHQLDPVLVASGVVTGNGRPPWRSAGVDVLVGHGRRHPGHRAVGGEADQGGHQAAGPALDLAAGLEGHRPAVGDQDKRGVSGQGRSTYRSVSELLKQFQPVAQQPRGEKAPARALLAGPPSAGPAPGPRESPSRAARTARRWRPESPSRRR